MKLEIDHLAAYVPYGIFGILTPMKTLVHLTAVFKDPFGSHEVQIDGLLFFK